MATKEVIYTSLAAPTKIPQPEQPTSLPQRFADWISYAVAVTQQVAPTAPDFTPAQG